MRYVVTVIMYVRVFKIKIQPTVFKFILATLQQPLSQCKSGKKSSRFLLGGREKNKGNGRGYSDSCFKETLSQCSIFNVTKVGVSPSQQNVREPELYNHCA